MLHSIISNPLSPLTNWFKKKSTGKNSKAKTPNVANVVNSKLLPNSIKNALAIAPVLSNPKAAVNAIKSTKDTTSTPKSETITTPTFSASVPQSGVVSGGSSGGGSGYASSVVSAPAYNEPKPVESDFKIDLSSMLAAFDKTAQSSRDMANTTYNTTRGDLLKSIERFREDHAKQVEGQKRAYLSNQASLQDARAEVNRMNRINAASRGLAGSGLQQLSQLQNLLNQSQDISELALSNQETMENLRSLLSRAEEDNATDLANAETARANAINSIESALGSNKANLEYNAAQTAKNQYLNALDAWNNRQFQASENAKSRALTQAQMAQDAADRQYAAQTAYDNALSTLNSSLNSLYKSNSSRTLSSYAAEAGYDISSTDIDKMTQAQKNELKAQIAEGYAKGMDATLSNLDIQYALPTENSKNNKKTVNDILAAYKYDTYY